MATEASTEKAGDFLARCPRTLPPSGPCLGSLCSIRFARELSKRNALSNDLANG